MERQEKEALVPSHAMLPAPLLSAPVYEPPAHTAARDGALELVRVSHMAGVGVAQQAAASPVVHGSPAHEMDAAPLLSAPV